MLLMSCGKNASSVNSPLVSIIKLQSSEVLEEFDEAKKYQDINKLYGKYAEELSVSPEKYWMDYVTSKNKLGRDKKFTNQVKYFDYNIEEFINGDESRVIFNSRDKSDRMQAIIYDLKLVNSNWVLQKIEYKITDRK